MSSVLISKKFMLPSSFPSEKKSYQELTSVWEGVTLSVIECLMNM